MWYGCYEEAGYVEEEDGRDRENREVLYVVYGSQALPDLQDTGAQGPNAGSPG